MTEFWYYEPVLDQYGSVHLCKILLVVDANKVAQAKYNLTNMGVGQINSYKELQEMFPQTFYEFNKIRKAK